MKIFVDFDDVLFNTKAFAADMVALFARHGVTREQFDESYYAFPHRDPRKQITFLSEHYGADAEALMNDLELFITCAEDYLFPDTHEFLRNFDLQDLYLLSFGAKVFQRMKIEHTGIVGSFKKVIVTQNKKVDEITQVADDEKFCGTEKIILIDDHPEQLQKDYRGECDITFIHLRRLEGRYSKHGCRGCDAEATDLLEARTIIERMKGG